MYRPLDGYNAQMIRNRMTDINVRIQQITESLEAATTALMLVQTEVEMLSEISKGNYNERPTEVNNG